MQANITTVEDSNLDYVVNMTAYEQYNPCQFCLADSVNGSATRGLAVKATVKILDDKTPPTRNWTASNEAAVSTA